jgi:hypothetical protein
MFQPLGRPGGRREAILAPLPGAVREAIGRFAVLAGDDEDAAERYGLAAVA